MMLLSTTILGLGYLLTPYACNEIGWFSVLVLIILTCFIKAYISFLLNKINYTYLN